MDNAKVILDLNNWQGFVVILVAILGLFILVGNAVKTWRELKKPKDNEVMSDRERLQTIATQLEKHEQEIIGLREGLRVMCEASKAMLEHAIHNGNTAEMEKASKSIDTYLQKKI